MFRRVASALGVSRGQRGMTDLLEVGTSPSVAFRNRSRARCWLGSELRGRGQGGHDGRRLGQHGDLRVQSVQLSRHQGRGHHRTGRRAHHPVGGVEPDPVGGQACGGRPPARPRRTDPHRPGRGPGRRRRRSGPRRTGERPAPPAGNGEWRRLGARPNLTGITARSVSAPRCTAVEPVDEPVQKTRCGRIGQVAFSPTGPDGLW